MPPPSKVSKITAYYGHLIDMITGDKIRPATAREAAAINKAANGVVIIDGRTVGLAVDLAGTTKGPHKPWGFKKPGEFNDQMDKAPRRKQVAGAKKAAKRAARGKK